MEEYLQETLDRPKPKIFSKKAIHLGTLLGGPFVTGYLLSENFKAFGEHNRSKISLVIGTVSSLLFMLLIFTLPEKISDKIPSHFIPLINILIEYLIVQKYQASRIDEYLESGSPKGSLWKVAGVSLVVLAIMLSPALLYLGKSNIEGTVLKFGKIQHEIYYQPTNISAEQVKMFSEQLTVLNVFNDESKCEMSLKRTANIYELSIPVIDGAWNNPEAIGFFKCVRDSLQSLNPDKVVLLNFVYPDMSTIQMTLGKDIVRTRK
jgi:hypothetical protein